MALGNGSARYGSLFLGTNIVVAVMLADDARVWMPTPPLQKLWTRLRVETLRAIWGMAGKASATGARVDARSVALRVLCNCRKLILQHWFRVGLSRSALGECPQWLLSRHPGISLEEFQTWWCASGVLCRTRVSPSGGVRPVLEVRWDVHSPVPVPLREASAALFDDGLDVDLAVELDLDVIDSYD